MKLKTAATEYIEKARLLSREEAERVFVRMRKKLTRRLEDDKVDPLTAVALQLQLEDEQLEEWRKNLNKIRGKQ